ncbi:hypothetical protein ACH4GM_16050 [Streptomyces coeruleorubidus]|uniref:hypothetical protein n=1 Tax=Streptomyces coeruleorubidus TaxID=116188 RepID=UPI003787F79F
MVKSFTRIAVAGASLALVYAGSTPAWAADDVEVQWDNKVISLSAGRGDMAFHDDGDVFEVCDTKADGAGVTGYVYERDPVTMNVKMVRSVSDGGDTGCGKISDYDVGRWQIYMLLDSHADGVSSVKSEWFTE